MICNVSHVNVEERVRGLKEEAYQHSYHTVTVNIPSPLVTRQDSFTVT
jgi:hypothetical protein